MPLSLAPSTPASGSTIALFAQLSAVWTVVRDRIGRLVSCNQSYIDFQARPEVSALGSALDCVAPSFVLHDRMRWVRLALEAQAPMKFVQLFNGRRIITHIWPLDPQEFPDGGWMAVGEPGSAPVGNDYPLSEVPHWGELEALSRRELEVLHYVAKGCTLAETATAVHRSAKTIERHVSSLHRKLKLRGRAAVVRYAAERGLHAFTAEQWRTLTEQRRVFRPNLLSD